MPVCVANIDGLPQGSLRILQGHSAALEQHTSIDELLAIPALLRVIEDLDALCIREGVVGFHFTRAMRGSILKDGLVMKAGIERRCNFIAEFGHHFTEEQRRRIQQAWESYFPGQQDRSRNGRVCLALTRQALIDGGAEPLLKHFGGEAIYMPLTQYPDVVDVLSNLGEPLIVQCALDTTRSKAYYEHPWGCVWLSSYHCSINPQARQLDQNVSASCSIPPADIISVTNAQTGL
jgi:hypothetical protein